LMWRLARGTADVGTFGPGNPLVWNIAAKPTGHTPT